MVLSTELPTAHFGVALAVPCRAAVETFEQLNKEAEALWVAEAKKKQSADLRVTATSGSEEQPSHRLEKPLLSRTYDRYLTRAETPRDRLPQFRRYPSGRHHRQRDDVFELWDRHHRLAWRRYQRRRQLPYD